MKKTVSPNRKTGRIIAKNLIILLVLTVITFVSMWSWFTSNPEATADGLNVKCSADEGIEIAVVAAGAEAPASTDYKSNFVLTKSDSENETQAQAVAEGEGASETSKVNLLDDLTLTEITSDGITFVRPNLKQINGIATPVIYTDEAKTAKDKWSAATPQVHYLSFDLYMRSKNQVKVYLDSTSKFVPKSTHLTGTNATNVSSYCTEGNIYSCDCIVGAARFSVVDKTLDTPTRKLLWIPHPELYLNTVNNENGGNSFVMINDLAMATANKSNKHSYYEVDADGSQYSPRGEKPVTIENGVTASRKSGNDYILGENVQLAALTGTADSNGYYYNHVTCNMWIEGEDPEAKLALVGGEFTLDFKLTGS